MYLINQILDKYIVNLKLDEFYFFLHQRLKENEFENEDRFHKWAEKALNGTLDISRTEGK